MQTPERRPLPRRTARGRGVVRRLTGELATLLRAVVVPLFVVTAVSPPSVAAVAAATGDDGVLVHYDFEGADPATGPYTLMVFEAASGSVGVTTTYRHGGYRAVEIRDVAGDGDFAELQGYFPDVTSGELVVGFAFMTATPQETFNIALAGRSHFTTMAKHGIGFWLAGEDGVLHHVTGGRSEALFALDAFVWYRVDLAYDVDRGRYDLTIHREDREQAVVRLTDRPNSLGMPGSGLHMFSFIGDRPGIDRSDVRLYVDDIFVASPGSGREAPAPFVAPGRRMLFVDIWDHYRARVLERPGCLPVLNHTDFALETTDLERLADLGRLGTFDALADGRHTVAWQTVEDARLRRLLQAMALWGQGCRELGERPEVALRLFDAADARADRARLHAISKVLALAGAKRWAEADELFLSVYADWHDDPRFPAVAASLGLARGDLERAESWLATSRESLPESFGHPVVRRLWSGRIDRHLLHELKRALPDSWPALVETALTAEQRYYVLLWRQRYEEAGAYASRMVELFRAMELPAGRWLERFADARFYAGDYEDARRGYEAGLGEGGGERTALLLKLSDVHHELGDPELERLYREKVYGSLAADADRLQPAAITAPGLGHSGPESCPAYP